MQCKHYSCPCCIALLEIEPCAGMRMSQIESDALDAAYEHVHTTIPHTCLDCACSECIELRAADFALDQWINRP